MKKLLLLLIAVLASAGVNAAPFNNNWTDDAGHSLTGQHNAQGHAQSLAVNQPGSLAAWVAAVANEDGTPKDAGNPFMGVGEQPDVTTLVITGTLNADDFAALSTLKCKAFAKFANIDLSSVVLSSGATEDDVMAIDLRSASWNKGAETISGNGAKFIRLPNGVTDVTKMRSLTENGHNPNLKVAGAYEGSPTASGNPANKTEFAAYSFESGNMAEFCNTLFHFPDGTGWELTGNPHGNDLQKITFGGFIGVNDIADGGDALFKSSNLNVFDLLESKFDDCDIAITSSMGQGYLNPTPVGTTVHSNALHYLKLYKVMSCILPKYNDEIPPQTFANNTFDAQTVHIGDIVIPEGYKKIGFEAFYGHNLQTLDLPSTLEEVEAGAFRHNPGMSRLTDVTMQPLQGECSFGEAAFGENQMLKHVTLSEGVTNIADQMFNQCLLLESIRIPTTCKTIGRRAFYECYDLHVITIPEGVEEIYQEAFELTGLTDIYVMATSPATMPKIYAMGADGGSTNSTFTYQRTTGNNTVPAAHRKDLPWVNDGYDEVVSWYQAEMSGAHGLGTGNALVALHYPDNMKGFYEGINVSDFFTEDELADVCGWSDSEIWVKLLNGPGVSEADINEKIHGVDAQGNKFQYLPQAYSIDPHGDGSNPLMGPDKDGKYYPNQMDYVMRMAAGATPGNCMSAWGWRQFPLAAAVGDIGKIPFDKLYDDTWYTMCFPWHMTDNELFSAFNQNMEITEFVGVELIEQGDPEQNAANKDWSYEMVFHFDDVAVTTYRDIEDVEYTRERIGHREINGEDRSVYRYTSKDGNNTVVEYPLSYFDLNEQQQNSAWQNPPGKDNNSEEANAVRVAYGKYLSIRNILSNAGHPYMIHPSIGAQPGNPATVYINAELKTGSPWTTNEQKVTKVATIDDQAKGDMNQGATEQPNKGGQTAFVNPVTNGGGSYTFIGNVGKEGETDNADADGNKVMPTPAYFLAVPLLYSEQVVEPIYEEVQVPVMVDGKQVYIYKYEGEGQGQYQRSLVEDHYEYVGEGGQYIPTSFGPKTTSNPAYEVATYDFNSSNMTYVGPNAGNYNPATYVQSTGTGHYNKTAEAYYQHTYQGGGEYKATKFESVNGTGEYQGNYPEKAYQYALNNGNCYVYGVTQVAGGSYNEAYDYTYNSARNGGYDATEFVQQNNGIQDEWKYLVFKSVDASDPDAIYHYNGVHLKYVGQNNQGNYRATNYAANSSNTGYFDRDTYYVYAGYGQGNYNVTFTEGAWGKGYDYFAIGGSPDLQYSDSKTGNWHVTEYTYVGPGQGDWNFVPATYEYVAAGNADWEAQSFNQVGDYQGSYVKNDASQADWIYKADGTGAFEATAWREAGQGETGTYNFVPMSIQYVDVGAGNGSYSRTPKMKTEKHDTGQTQTITVNHYDKYPKYYRKKQTSGNKWSKYSAIIQPDADAIANIEAFLDMAAAANGYNVALGEWEEVSTTAIEKIVEDAERNNEPVQKIHLNVVYNIKGQVVRNDGNASLEGLPKGLYIVNGKKYMVK